jgi:hypothetical protein
MIGRAMLCGAVAEPAAYCGARFSGALVEVRVAHGLQLWRVYAGRPAVVDELAKIAEGDVVACLGQAQWIIGPDNRPCQIMTADGVLTLRQNHDHVAPSPAPEAAPFPVEAYDRALDRLVATAHAAGVAEERGRIAAIMNAPSASPNPALAWRLAQSAVTREAAEAALAISNFASLPADAGEGDAARVH